MTRATIASILVTSTVFLSTVTFMYLVVLLVTSTFSHFSMTNTVTPVVYAGGNGNSGNSNSGNSSLNVTQNKPGTGTIKGLSSYNSAQNIAKQMNSQGLVAKGHTAQATQMNPFTGTFSVRTVPNQSSNNGGGSGNSTGNSTGGGGTPTTDQPRCQRGGGSTYAINNCGAPETPPTEPTVRGCTDRDAFNYNRRATIDNGNCKYRGCTDARADNYDPRATHDNGTCRYTGCMHRQGDEYRSLYNVRGRCTFSGCMYAEARNYFYDQHPSAENYRPRTRNHTDTCNSPRIGFSVSPVVEYDSRADITCDNNGFRGSCRILELDRSCTSNNSPIQSNNLTERSSFTYRCTNTSRYAVNPTRTVGPRIVEVEAPEISLDVQPRLIRAGEQVTISWNPNGYNGTCTITPDDEITSNPNNPNTSGDTVTQAGGEVTYTYECTDTNNLYADGTIGGTTYSSDRKESVTVRVVGSLEET